MSERDKILAEKLKLKKVYGTLFDELSSILFALDPMEIGFETNTDEYEPEVATILPRLRDCNTKKDVREVVYQEFHKWFGDAGVEEDYEEAAANIWRAWRIHMRGH